MKKEQALTEVSITGKSRHQGYVPTPFA